ncbi:hypothetical protein DUNSADRAFT_8832 [Dunaliella salina]|uniref:Uncharacterized protein n=1 Tax=Dunaliella salina TaxID=3046 RepID=A0ABQ7GIP5_DUNSA|nr:hypothetical protein DUNSADRAFT_8832 [Dunaliella salina]|eukprot:KAF5834476.1 hypothetical protein DUNSADRAFT_8832 [Dunaliella salina]
MFSLCPGLNERVIRVDVNNKALETRKLLEEEKRQEMLHQKWNDSVFLPHCKHTPAASDMTLSNTLLPCDIDPRDLRVTHRHSRTASLASPASSPSRANSQSPTSTSTGNTWNSSTAYSSKELADRSQALLGSSLKATRARATSLLASRGGRHLSLVEQQAALADAVRQQKVTQAEEKAALVQKYGEEGAAAMQAIMAMPRQEKQPHRSTRRPSPRTEDVKAVQQLPDEVPGALPPSRSTSEKENDQGS